MSTREAFDKLLASKPGVELASYDPQPEHEIWARDVHTGEMSILTTEPPGPWVCVDFADKEKFAIWKNTGNIYRVGDNGAVEEDPIEL